MSKPSTAVTPPNVRKAAVGETPTWLRRVGSFLMVLAVATAAALELLMGGEERASLALGLALGMSIVIAWRGIWR